MLFQFNLTLTEDDYFAYNRFHAVESIQGKKSLRYGRLLFLLFTVILTILVVSRSKSTFFAVTYTVIGSLASTIYLLMFKKINIHALKSHIQQLKKTGRLPFDPVSTLAFYEDRFVETTATKHTELGYDNIERICILKDRYIFLYQSSIGAYILPIPQIKAQANPEELLRFLSQKCNKVEYY